MLTSAECQAKADAKFAQAKREPRNHKRLLATAEGWVVCRAAVWADYNGDGKPDLLLATAEGWVVVAGIMGRLEASGILPDDRQQE